MTTIINTPPSNNESEDGISGMIIFVLALGTLLIIAYLLIPILRRGVSTPSVSIPDKIDVNVNTQGSQ